MKKIPTANKLIRENDTLILHKVEYVSYKETRSLMVEFAKMHVEAALKEASEKARVQMGESYMREQIIIHPNSLIDTVIITADAESILNSYSLDNIK